MATTYAASVTAHAGIGHATSTTGATTKDLTATNNSSSSNNSSAGCNGFKVYGSLFKVDARYQFLNPLGKGSYGIVWYVSTVCFFAVVQPCNLTEVRCSYPPVRRRTARRA